MQESFNSTSHIPTFLSKLEELFIYRYPLLYYKKAEESEIIVPRFFKKKNS